MGGIHWPNSSEIMMSKCAHCSKMFRHKKTVKRKYCKKKCMGNAIRKFTNGKCVQCKKTLKNDRKRKYCNRICHIKSLTIMGEIERKRICKFCHKIFHRRRGGGNETIFCTRSCAAIYRYGKDIRINMA